MRPAAFVLLPIYDADGNQLTRTDGTWFAARCRWSAKRRRIARAADVTTLHGLLSDIRHLPEPDTSCVNPVAVSAARGRHIDRMLAQQRMVRAATPEFVRRLALGDDLVGPATDDATDEQAEAIQDLPRLLAANMIWYVEWPHVDRRFIRLFKTVPGYWPGRPNGDPRPEAERGELDDIADGAADSDL